MIPGSAVGEGTLLKRASVVVSILYVACFVFTQVQIGFFTNRNWWGFPRVLRLIIIRITIIYAMTTRFAHCERCGVAPGKQAQLVLFHHIVRPEPCLADVSAHATEYAGLYGWGPELCPDGP